MDAKGLLLNREAPRTEEAGIEDRLRATDDPAILLNEPLGLDSLSDRLLEKVGLES